MTKRYARTPKAAEYLGLAESTLEKMRWRGDGPPFAKLGGSVVYEFADLDAWVSRNKQASTAEAVA